MALLDLHPVWAMPEELTTVIAQTPDAYAVYVTSPNYYGQVLDIPSISQACRQRGIPLLVDNAHGAHLMFTQPNLHPLTLGASMTACSAHKTLNVLTGGAWLNIAEPRFAEEAKAAMALFGSTSPNYSIMASLDLCRDWIMHNRDAFLIIQEQVQKLRELALSRGISLPGGQLDPLRLTLDTTPIGLSGTQAAEFFRASGVEPEYADARYVVLICTPFNSTHDFTRLAAAIAALPAGIPLRMPEHALPPLPETPVSLREALFAPTETVPLEKAAGRIAAEAACPCPPGMPVVMPGERIHEDAIKFLSGYGFFTIKVLK